MTTSPDAGASTTLTEPGDSALPPPGSHQLHEALLYRMMLIREFEEGLIRLFRRGELPGGVHLSVGQEAAAVGACGALEAADRVVMNFRSHGHALAKGSDPKRLMAEILAKATGLCGGKGGSVHLADVGVGNFGGSGIVGSQISVGTGVALASQISGDALVCMVFFGDGAAGEGLLYESMNLAGLWHLPVIFFCENNGYVATVRSAATVAGGSVASRAAGFGMPGVTVDGQDVLAVLNAASAAVARARAGDGPTLIEAKTFRFTEHAFGMRNVNKYGTQAERDEVADWIANRDPIALFIGACSRVGTLTDETVETIRQRAASEVREAVEFALNSPKPDLSAAFEGLYTTGPADRGDAV